MKMSKQSLVPRQIRLRPFNAAPLVNLPYVLILVVAFVAMPVSANYRCLVIEEAELDQLLQEYYSESDVVADLGPGASGIADLYPVKRVWKGNLGRETYLTGVEHGNSGVVPVTIVFAKRQPFNGPLMRMYSPPCYLSYQQAAQHMNRLFGEGRRPVTANTESQLPYFWNAWYLFIIFLFLFIALFVLQKLAGWSLSSRKQGDV
jgi:hypothetical protein